MHFLRCLVGWLSFSPVTSRVSARQPSYFLSAKPKESNQRKGEPRPCRFAVPCATRSVRDTCKLASLEISNPLNRLRRFPLQGTTPAARQSRLRGVPGRGCASLASPEWLVRCAHFPGGLKARGATGSVLNFHAPKHLRTRKTKVISPQRVLCADAPANHKSAPAAARRWPAPAA